MLLYVFVNSMSVKRTISRERLTGQICLVFSVPLGQFTSVTYRRRMSWKCPFSPPEPVVSWSRGSLQIKCGSGDENGKCLDKHRMRMRVLFYEIQDAVDVVNSTSSETQGANSGGEAKSKRAEKKVAPRKVKDGEKSPWDNVLPDRFRMVAAVLASDWCQKTFVFFCQSEGSRPWSRFVCSYSQST